jgi:hypothetical protein
MITLTRRTLAKLFLGLVARFSIDSVEAAAQERDLISFGAVYGEEGDTSKALLAAAKWSSANGGTIRISGLAILKMPLALTGNIKLRGSAENSALRSATQFTQPLLQISHGSARLEGLQISGTNERLQWPVALFRAGDLSKFELIDCRLSNHRAGLVAIFGCANVVLRGNTFENWGVTEVTKQGGPAVHLAALRGTNQPTHSVVVENNTFKNGEWVAISIYAQDTKILNNKIHDVKESGIFAFRQRVGDSPTDAAAQLEIVGNVIRGVVRKDISATGIEVGADHVTIRQNEISETESSGVKILDTAMHVVVTENHIVGTVRRPSMFHNHGQIQVQSHSTTDKAPFDVVIEKNVVTDTRKPATASYAFSAPLHESWAVIRALVVENNYFRGGYSILPVYVPSEERRYDYKEINNKI